MNEVVINARFIIMGRHYLVEKLAVNARLIIRI